MHFRVFIIFFVMLTSIFGQAQLTRAFGEELFFGAARSYAMGITHRTNANTSSLVRYNPSLLKSISKNKISLIDFQTNLSSVNERRSILGQDSFGDFLTMMDYVNNSNSYTYFKGGLVFDANNSISSDFFLSILVCLYSKRSYSLGLVNLSIQEFACDQYQA